MRELQSYHLVWLETHPHRSVEWLRQMMKDGFDIHHLDRNHANDAPGNLVLIEHTDHMRFHGRETLGRLTPKRQADGSKPKAYRSRSNGKHGSKRGLARYEAMKAMLASANPAS